MYSINPTIPIRVTTSTSPTITSPTISPTTFTGPTASAGVVLIVVGGVVLIEVGNVVLMVVGGTVLIKEVVVRISLDELAMASTFSSSTICKSFTGATANEICMLPLYGYSIYFLHGARVIAEE